MRTGMMKDPGGQENMKQAIKVKLALHYGV